MDRKDFLINTFDIQQIGINDVLLIEYKYSLYRLESDNSISYWHSDNAKSQPSENELNSLLEGLKSDWSKLQYARDRKREYPLFETQLDNIYHNGLDVWKANILAIKTKYPKGE